ncbi:aspartyl-phosphate phosphatase Spo0E family protein [Gottfriedia acidiceleris]|uniref:Aspartyl-phosphate phosphatase Spo0E family protein n=1 Tax=Gottfriedia acidiceleris TaxID=371036 RepID=A0ABY4JTQ4_9BACI|nr:aspartyl-phosphate phosphatase Spo0E family protein [Gottfriedia acidiceleris]UPM56012.1 aspartyl-phosphate phosphatase Spo0E family protein [Gottfriedia acidiceleris]
MFFRTARYLERNIEEKRIKLQEAQNQNNDNHQEVVKIRHQLDTDLRELQKLLKTVTVKQSKINIKPI